MANQHSSGNFSTPSSSGTCFDPNKQADGNFISDGLTYLANLVSGAFDIIVDNIGQLVDYVTNAISEVWIDVVEWASETWDEVSEWASGVWDDVTDWASDVWNDFSDWASETWNDITDWVSDSWNDFVSWISDTWDDFTSWVSDVWDDWFSSSSGGYGSSSSTSYMSSWSYDPMVIDLDGDGIELTGLENSNTYFDLTGDGFAINTSWVSADDGLLVIDRDRDGKISDIKELFGSPNAPGFTELAELDSNQDGLIDSADEQFSEIQIWQDNNGNGITDDGELHQLSDFNIASLNLNYNWIVWVCWIIDKRI
ncbi:phage tail protein [Gayadomonas joobiniege]|uniref:phage tail protein n=1 Tax=Gayadomonas joobiniege TaxID=1234606 RepID=UPI00037D17EC|nr:hypothetical protein [Gayadomonas joobiniege]